MKAIYFLIMSSLICISNILNAQEYKIFSIKAYMFYNQEKTYADTNNIYAGAFSENLVDSPQAALWNVIIGEGSAKAYSEQTLIVTEVGLTSEIIPVYRASLKIKVIAEGKTLLSETKDLMFFENKNYHYACLINDTGCNPLIITAELVDARSGKSLGRLEKTIPYGCGE
jgi:hypothetical protein